MPQQDYDVTTGLSVDNGRPTRSSDLHKIDQYAAWLGMVAHPMTPHVILGGNSESGGGSVSGLSTTSSSWSDWHYLELLIPPGVTFLAWGVVALGRGQIRFNPMDVGGSSYYSLKVTTENYNSAFTASSMETWWASDAVQTYSGDQPRAADMATGPGQRSPRLVTCRYQIKMVTTGFHVQSLIFQYLPEPPGTDFSAYPTSGAGGTDL